MDVVSIGENINDISVEKKKEILKKELHAQEILMLCIFYQMEK